ncbi:hypothetical protein FDI85_gp119 [Erwinia phage Machina]|uniref:Uncharacterized protein n=2 Tax=Machinavirus machina TaxID=2169990 RepID=A0A1B2ID81_9CAUD|nr:hypothetical protein BIZ81_gp118 [Erwinia phage vB_EamM_Huxley]YP_009617082.1 hypothetical protein FDI85_gp119 [Erwinia phage Machina]ANZ49247.1 hypothetical protein HUXLEY_165 [Erwinia phage vB_EamM_Huxley]ANZ49803.1 hypothetical protein MACHINA_165 [Erwinia phage Machina]
MAIITPQAQLVALFNAKNASLPQALVVADVTFGAVDVYTPGDGGDTRNTKLTITAVADNAHFTGEKELHYTRLSSGIVGPKAVTADLADWDTDAEVLAILNADVIAAGKTEDAFALADLTITREGTGTNEDPMVIDVSINAGHIKYLPGQVATYTVTEEIQKTDLSTTDGELDGFTVA